MDQSSLDHVQRITDSPDIKSAIGFIVDGVFVGGATAAWLLEIEHVIGGAIAAIVAIGALGSTIYRCLYWRAKYRNETKE